jgi:hypothetical protein
VFPGEVCCASPSCGSSGIRVKVKVCNDGSTSASCSSCGGSTNAAPDPGAGWMSGRIASRVVAVLAGSQRRARPWTGQPQSNASLWGSRPALGNRTGEIYLGRVFLEFFANGTSIVEAADGPLVDGALMAIDANLCIVADPATVPWTAEPVTRDAPNESVAGRVVLEVWSDSAMTTVLGPPEEMLARARQALVSLAGDRPALTMPRV